MSKSFRRKAKGERKIKYTDCICVQDCRIWTNAPVTVNDLLHIVSVMRKNCVNLTEIDLVHVSMIVHFSMAVTSSLSTILIRAMVTVNVIFDAIDCRQTVMVYEIVSFSLVWPIHLDLVFVFVLFVPNRIYPKVNQLFVAHPCAIFSTIFVDNVQFVVELSSQT